jgi:hypothetical protein
MKYLAVFFTVSILFTGIAQGQDKPQRDASELPQQTGSPIVVGRKGATFEITPPSSPHSASNSWSLSAFASALPGITAISFNGGLTSFGDDGSIYFHNVRVTSSSTDLDDYNRLKYSFNPTTMALELSEVATYPDMEGLYIQEYYFTKNVPDQIYLRRGSTTYNPWTYYNLTNLDFNTTFELDGVTAQKFSFYMENLSGDVRIIIKDPSGETVRDSILDSGGYWHADQAILQAGTYKIQFGPGDSASTLNMRLYFGNPNIHNYGQISNGSAISFTKRDNLSEYGVWWIDLVAGQTITVANNGYGRTLYTLVYQDNTFANSIDAGNGDGTLIHVAKKTGRYYYFAEPYVFDSGTYYGTISVVNALAFSSWSRVHMLPPLEQDEDDDPDDDGLVNIEEYALGADPLESSPEALPGLVKTGAGSFQFQFNQPIYVTDISYTVDRLDLGTGTTTETLGTFLVSDGLEYDILGANIPLTGASGFFHLTVD